jgi:site-specific DNA-methyltransferase (adenine-specific)
MQTIDSNSIDCVITDCPYHIIAGGVRIVDWWDECSGVLQKRDYSKTDPKWVLDRGRRVVSDWTACSNKWLKKDALNIPSAVKNWKMFENNSIEFKDWLPDVYRILKDWTHCYIMINWRNLKDLWIEAEKVWFEYQNLLVRDKGNATPNKYYMQCLEFILMLRKWPARNINNMGSTNKLSVWNIIWNKEHPTEKPVNLMRIMIENSTNIWDIVLDPFCWVGGVCIAADNTQRKYIGIDIDQEYINITNRRLDQQQKPLF